MPDFPALIRAMRYFSLLILCSFFMLPAAMPAAAQTTAQPLQRIVATVNDELITTSDVSSRLALAFFSSNLPDTPENRARLLPQVLRTLIDEQLQRQEAKRLGITVPPDEIKAAATRLAQENNLALPQLESAMQARGVPTRALYNQIEAGLLWSRVITRRLRPLVEVGAEEVQARLERLQANAGKTEYLVAEIFLRVDEEKDEPEVQALATRLVEQIKAGASFPALAQQFSQSAGAMQGGDLGWVQQGQLAAELDSALQDMRSGMLSDPVRAPAGYHILLVRDTRLAAGLNPAAVRVTLSQVFLPAGDDLPARAARLRDAVRGCDDLDSTMKDVDAQAVTRALGQKNLSELPAWLGQSVQSLSAGQATEIYEVEGGALFAVLCARNSDGAGGPTAEQITQQIGTERLELQARRLLRDLRRQAAVEIRQ